MTEREKLIEQCAKIAEAECYDESDEKDMMRRAAHNGPCGAIAVKIRALAEKYSSADETNYNSGRNWADKIAAEEAREEAANNGQFGVGA